MSSLGALKDSVRNFLDRTDIDTSLPTFVTLAEAKFRRDLRVQDMVKVDTVTVDSEGGADLPERWLGFLSVTLSDDSRTDMQLMSASKLREILGTRETGRPRAYAIEGNRLNIAPGEENADIDIVYWEGYAPLVDDGDTNWILQNAYDLFLYETLRHAEIWAENEANAARYGSIADATTLRLNAEAQRAMKSGSAIAAAGRWAP